MRWVVTALVAVGAAGCTSGDTAAPATTAITTPATVAEPVDDGVLRIGVLLPMSGDGASIGESQLAAVRVAVDLARTNRGDDDVPIELIVRDEGSDAVAASVSFQDLLVNQVDAIIGPASSTTAIALAPAIVQAGVVACSPSASAMALDDFPDEGRIFRTIPSDSLQAEAMAEMIEQTGETTASIAFIDDGYGRPFDVALEAALRRRGISVTASVGYAVDDAEFTSEAQRVTEGGSGAIALIGDPGTGSRFLAALAQAVRGTSRDIVVNDALRGPWSIGLLSSVPDETRERVFGVSPYVQTDNEALLQAIASQDVNATGLFATQAYDCANLLMLAADVAGGTQGSLLASMIPGISAGGSVCATFAQCHSLIDEGRNVDYDGPSGRLTLNAAGELSSAQFDVFGFDETGRDSSIRRLEVSAP